MNSIAAHFESLGMTPADAASRAELFGTLEKRSHPILEGAPHWRRFTPGRIEIFGKHTDYAGGRSLTCAVERGFAVSYAPRRDGLVRIFDAQDPGASGPEFLSSHRRRVIFAWIIVWADPYRYTLTLLIAWPLTFVVATLFVCLIDGLS